MSASRSAALAILAALALAACQAETAPAERPPRPVKVASVIFADDAVSRDFVGVIAPRTETDLAFRVGGKVVARLVGVGDRVKAGDVIARLDAEDLTLQLEGAEAERAAATSSLAQASADLERFDSLKERGHATTADFDRKQLARDEASARLERASRTLDLARRQVAYAELTATPTASSPPPPPSRGRWWRSASRWRRSPISTARKPWSRSPRTGSASPARRRRR